MRIFTKQRDTVNYLLERKQRLQAQYDAGDVFPCEWNTVEKLIFEIGFEAQTMPEFTKYMIAEKMTEYKTAKEKECFYCDENGSDYFKKAVIYEAEDKDPYILVFVDTSWLDDRE